MVSKPRLPPGANEVELGMKSSAAVLALMLLDCWIASLYTFVSVSVFCLPSHNSVFPFLPPTSISASISASLPILVFFWRLRVCRFVTKYVTLFDTLYNKLVEDLNIRHLSRYDYPYFVLVPVTSNNSMSFVFFGSNMNEKLILSRWWVTNESLVPSVFCLPSCPTAHMYGHKA